MSSSFLLDRFASSDSPIHRLDPRVKVLSAVLAIFSNVFIGDGKWLAFAVVWLLILFVTQQATLNPIVLLKRSLIAIPFSLVAITLLFTVDGNALFSWEIATFTLSATDAGLTRFLTIVIRSWLSVQIAILLTMTTKLPDILHALRHLKVPTILVSIIAFMYRYLQVLIDEAQRLLRARASRSAAVSGHKSGGSLRWRAKVAGNMVGQLLLRSFERSDRVYNAMVSRGYRGEMLTMNAHHMRSKDWGFLGLCVIGIVLVQGIGRLL